MAAATMRPEWIGQYNVSSYESQNQAPEDQFHTPQPPTLSTYAGQKRKQCNEDTDEIERQAQISCQFKKLRLNHQPPIPSNPIGISIRSNQTDVDSTSTYHIHDQIKIPRNTNKTDDETEYMKIDPHPNLVIIDDLESEIAEIESFEKNIVQLQNSNLTNSQQKSRTGVRGGGGGIEINSEIDKKLSSIPDYLLRRQSGSKYTNLNSFDNQINNNNNKALILYKDPISISIPEEEDAVRKAVIATRKRMRDKQTKELNDERREVQDDDINLDERHFQSNFHNQIHQDEINFDPDAMDIE